MNTPSAVARASVRREFAATALGGQTAPQRVGYRSAVIAAGAEGHQRLWASGGRGHGTSTRAMRSVFAQLATNEKLRV